MNEKKYNCKSCNDTGWYGDNGPGIKGNSEYMPCDQCDRGKDRKDQARAIRVGSPLRRFTNAMHTAKMENKPVDRFGEIDLPRLLKILGDRIEILEDSIKLHGGMFFCDQEAQTVSIALCAAEIAGRTR